MNIRTLLVIIAIMLLVAGAVISSGWGDRRILNIKVTLTAETPSGIVSNSTVLQLRATRTPARFGRTSFSTLGLFGEAPSLEIEPGRVIFAMNLYEPYGVTREFARHYGGDSGYELAERIANDQSRPVITASVVPILVTFTNPDDPRTIKEVHPQALNRDFGNGINFKSIKYQVTRDPVTKNVVASVLEWMPTHRGSFRKGAEIRSSGSPDVAGFNRSVLGRYYRCVVDGFLVNNLTYGYFRSGLGCSYLP